MLIVNSLQSQQAQPAQQHTNLVAPLNTQTGNGNVVVNGNFAGA